MTTRQTEGALAAAARLEAREVRSYEAEGSGANSLRDGNLLA
jgi:hypothetical protein